MVQQISPSYLFNMPKVPGTKYMIASYIMLAEPHLSDTPGAGYSQQPIMSLLREVNQTVLSATRGTVYVHSARLDTHVDRHNSVFVFSMVVGTSVHADTGKPRSSVLHFGCHAGGSMHSQYTPLFRTSEDACVFL